MRRTRREDATSKQEKWYREAPSRIRKAGSWCILFGWVSLLAGLAAAMNSPTFGGDAYTEIVEQLSRVNGMAAVLAAVVLFVGGAVWKALADILDELRRTSAPRLGE